MRDITADMLRFKEAARHIWNTYLLELDSPMSPVVQDARDLIERELFRTIVLNPCGAPIEANNYRIKPIAKIEVHPKKYLTEISLQYGNRDVNGNTVYEMPVLINAKDFPLLHFFDFFDWDANGHLDWAVVRAVDVVKTQTVLIKQVHCDFVFNDKP